MKEQNEWTELSHPLYSTFLLLLTLTKFYSLFLSFLAANTESSLPLGALISAGAAQGQGAKTQTVSPLR